MHLMKIGNMGFAALCSACLLSVPALADTGIATISDVEGKVLVNAGEGFVPAAADMVLKTGDRVFVGEQSLATLSYETCAVLLDEPSVVTVSADGGCNVATSVQPAHARPLPRAGGVVNAPPALLFGTFALGVTCIAACNEIFGDKEISISGR